MSSFFSLSRAQNRARQISHTHISACVRGVRTSGFATSAPMYARICIQIARMFYEYLDISTTKQYDWFGPRRLREYSENPNYF